MTGAADLPTRCMVARQRARRQLRMLGAGASHGRRPVPSARMVQVRWRRTDLDFPVLMLRTSAWPPSLASVRGGPVEGLSIVSFSYGDGDERLHLRTVARRGRRVGPDGLEPVGDLLVDQVGQAVSDLLFSRIRPGDQPSSATRQRVDEAVQRGQQLASQFPGPPWQVRSVPVDWVSPRNLERSLMREAV
jgi:hypothetical protein